MNSFEKKVFVFTAVIVILIALVTVSYVLYAKTSGDRKSPDLIDTQPKPVQPAKPQTVIRENHSNTYTELMKKHMDTVSGNCQWGYLVFSEDAEYLTESYAVPSASIIKVFIMEYAFSLIEKGELSLNDYIQGISVETLIYNMITISDNNATNILISEFGMDNLNSFFKECGYSDTVVQRKMLDTAAQAEGRDNFTSASDTMAFLKKLYVNKDISPYSNMLDIMKKQQVATKIRRNFGPETVIANKTGELTDVENDIGIIFGENGDMAVAFLCSNLTDTASAKNAIANAAYDLAADTIMEHGR